MSSTERFSFEWKKYPLIIPEYEMQFLKWVYPLRPKDFKGKRVLDAGGGTGRNSFWPLIYGAKEIVAFDYDREIVKVAKKNLSRFKNAEIAYKSIYDIKYDEKFDIVFSIGVIHHLDKPTQAIKNLIRATKRNGLVLIWVYGHDGNRLIIPIINLIRFFTSKLPLEIVNITTYLISIPIFIYLKLFKQQNLYLRQLSKFRFRHIHNIVFDQLIPKIAHYWKKGEVLDLFKDERLKGIRIYPVNNNSWTILGKRI